MSEMSEQKTSDQIDQTDPQTTLTENVQETDIDSFNRINAKENQECKINLYNMYHIIILIESKFNFLS
jgi:hypothetical protein